MSRFGWIREDSDGDGREIGRVDCDEAKGTRSAIASGSGAEPSSWIRPYRGGDALNLSWPVVAAAM